MDRLFVTSAHNDEESETDEGGSLFVVDGLGVTGVQATKAAF